MLKLEKEQKQLMERELKQYWINKKQLEKLETEMVNDFDKETIVNRTATRTLIYLKQRITYIENVYKQLKPFEEEVHNLIFQKCYDWRYCESTKNISKSTYYNIYNKSIELLAKEWGIL